MNELYRTGQVGQQTTLANSSLLAERATGFEFGGELERAAGRLRATYFWTEVNRPISAVLLSQTATTQTLQRQNLGQIRSRGLMLEAQTARWRGLDAGFGYQLAVATVTAFNSSSPAQANLTGNWIPEVPRQAVTATLNGGVPRIAAFHVIASYTGRTFDDAANQYILHPYARFDVSAERALPHGLALFAGAQNLLNRSIDAGHSSPVVCASVGASRSSLSAMSVSAFEPSNGSRPVSARNATAPSAYKSARSSTRALPLTCSGAMYANDPSVASNAVSDGSLFLPWRDRIFDTPKSRMRVRSSGASCEICLAVSFRFSMNRFAGLMSRWMTPA